MKPITAEAVQKEIDNIRALGVKIVTNAVVGRAMTIDELLNDDKFDAVFVGSGAGLPNFQRIPGESLCGVYSANEFLTRINLMKAYTFPQADTPVKVGSRVAVVGGGNVAVDAARTSARLGGEDVQMFCLESRETMPASDEEVEETLAENIAINNGWGPKEFLKDKNGKVTGVVFKKCLSVFDASGKFAPKYDENDTMEVEADYVITSIGQCIECACCSYVCPAHKPLMAQHLQSKRFVKKYTAEHSNEGGK